MTLDQAKEEFQDAAQLVRHRQVLADGNPDQRLFQADRQGVDHGADDLVLGGEIIVDQAFGNRNRGRDL